MTLIAGFDLATRCCGVTVGSGEGRPAVGVFHYEYVGEDLGLLLEAFDLDLERLRGAHGMPTHLVYEAPVLVKQNTLIFMRKVHGMGAYLELWARRQGATCEEASPSALKKRLTGDHQASKIDMVNMCKRLGLPLPPGEAAKDAADSVAAWLIGLQHHGDRGHLTKWDQAVYSRRGFIT